MGIDSFIMVNISEIKWFDVFAKVETKYGNKPWQNVPTVSIFIVYVSSTGYIVGISLLHRIVEIIK